MHACMNARTRARTHTHLKQKAVLQDLAHLLRVLLFELRDSLRVYGVVARGQVLPHLLLRAELLEGCSHAAVAFLAALQHNLAQVTRHASHAMCHA